MDDYPGRSERGRAVLIVTIITLIFSTLFTLFRLISRFGVVRRVSWDDYGIIFAWFLAFGMSFAICYGTGIGLGMHEVDIPVEWRARLRKSEYAFSVLYNPALMATKTSILLFYRTLAKGNKIFRWSTYTTLFVVNAAGLALTFLNIFQCRPIAAALQTKIPQDARCTDVVTLYLSSAPVNIITDLAILFLPMPILTAMRLPRKQKTILVVTFGVGFFVAVVDVIRIVYLQDAALNRLEASQMGSDSASDSRNRTDLSWYASLSFMWSAVEVNVGIMCANVPGLKPLVSRFMPYVLRDKGEQSRLRFGYTYGSQAGDVPPTMPGNTSTAVETKDHALSSPADKTRTSADNNHHPAEEHEQQDRDLGLMDFLTTPDMAELPQSLQREVTTKGSVSAPSGPNTFFDFVVMKRKKSLVKLTTKESLSPNIIVTVLFFMWGIAYGFLDTLNSRFQSIAGMTKGQSVGIHSAYFGAYLLGSLTLGRWVLCKVGFKACFIVGLFIYACGVLVFWPSAVLTSFPAFLISNFIVGLGLSLLEIAANPFVALCGPARYMEVRLNLSQGVQAIGTIVSPLLATKVLFKDSNSAKGLIDVQWTYLGIALFTTLLAVAIFYIPLPEATDDELEEASEHPDLLNLAEVKGTQLVKITLVIACIAQFCYVGAQEAVSTSMPAYLSNQIARGTKLVNVDSNGFFAIGHTTFAAGRFICAFLNIFIKARLLLMFFFLGSLVCSILVFRLTNDSNEAFVLLLFFFEAPLFPLIFAIALRGLGRFTKDGSALLTAAISGGGVFPPIMYAIGRSDPQRVMMAYSVIVAGFAIGAIFPAYLNLFPLARHMADPVSTNANLPHHINKGKHRTSSDRRESDNSSIIGGGLTTGKIPDSRRESSTRQDTPDSGPDFLTTPDFLRS